MAKARNIVVYEQIAAGKRLVSVPTSDLTALRVWLWRNGYSSKTNILGEVANVLITKKGE